MPKPELLAEAGRQMAICNACRYCEGYCAVFPAMELRTSFSAGDLTYLANLCHDCRGCYYACQYAPPHEFGVNVPRIFAELRLETYQDYSLPQRLSGLIRRSARTTGILTTACVAVLLALVLWVQGSDALTREGVGAGAFYSVISYRWMVLPAATVLLWAGAAMLTGCVRFWRHISSPDDEPIDAGSLVTAVFEALRLENLKGGADGCNYPSSGFSHARRRLHHLVAYGFLIDVASTVSAAVWDHLLHRVAPHPYFSLPVVLGTVGGVALLIGSSGLLYLKRHSDEEPTASGQLSLDISFLSLLLATSLTGLLLLALRETAAMGTLLVIHLGTVAGLFLTLPYGKFVHLGFHLAALLRNSVERSRSDQKGRQRSADQESL